MFSSKETSGVASLRLPLQVPSQQFSITNLAKSKNNNSEGMNFDFVSN